MDESAVAEARAVVLALLEARAAGASVCPSKAARALSCGEAGGSSANDWRSAMPLVHASVDQLLAEGSIWLSWKGKALRARSGPYRINRGTPSEL